MLQFTEWTECFICESEYSMIIVLEKSFWVKKKGFYGFIHYDTQENTLYRDLLGPTFHMHADHKCTMYTMCAITKLELSCEPPSRNGDMKKSWITLGIEVYAMNFCVQIENHQVFSEMLLGNATKKLFYFNGSPTIDWCRRFCTSSVYGSRLADDEYQTSRWSVHSKNNWKCSFIL